MQIDVNCDMGESFGAWQMGSDAQVLPYVSSVNIACGFHAGDPNVMHQTVKMALAQGVAIGAHPGFPDLVGFGRRAMSVSAEEVYNLMVYQIGALNAFVTAQGGRLHHVKPHGALYNISATDSLLAQAIAQAVYDVDRDLILYGLAGSELILKANACGLRVAQEVFADRTYQSDGTLTPRTHPKALIENASVAIAQVLGIVQNGKILSNQGDVVMVNADTICLHGDGAQAVGFAKALYEALTQAGISIKAK